MNKESEIKEIISQNYFLGLYEKIKEGVKIKQKYIDWCIKNNSVECLKVILTYCNEKKYEYGKSDNINILKMILQLSNYEVNLYDFEVILKSNDVVLVRNLLTKNISFFVRIFNFINIRTVDMEIIREISLNTKYLKQFDEHILHKALLENREDISYFIVSHPEIKFSTKEDIFNSFVLACSKGYTEIVKILLKSDKIDVNVDSRMDGKSPIFFACRFGYTQIAKLLLEYNEVKIGFNLLKVADHYKHIEIVRILLDDRRIDPLKFLQYLIPENDWNFKYDIISLLLKDRRINFYKYGSFISRLAYNYGEGDEKIYLQVFGHPKIDSSKEKLDYYAKQGNVKQVNSIFRLYKDKRSFDMQELINVSGNKEMKDYLKKYTS